MTSPITAPAVPEPSHRDDIYRAPLLLAAFVFVLVYGVELSGFGLSIDEEAATYVVNTGQAWLQQGRWGMALLTMALPNYEAIPLLSTLMLGAGLLFAVWRGFRDFRLSQPQAFLFGAVQIGFPVWLHIAQFNTVAGGFGFGIAAAALGAGAATSGRKSGMLAGALLIAFAASVYQTLAVYALLYIVLSLHAKLLLDPRTRLLDRAVGIQVLLAGLSWAAGLVAYWVIEKFALFLTRADITYVDSFIQIDLLRTDPLAAASAIRGALLPMLLGTHPAYLGWGFGVLLLSWAGLLPLRVLAGRGQWWAGRRNWFVVLAVAAIGILLVSVPTILSMGTLPLRAYVPLPLLAAWLASRCCSNLALGTTARQWVLTGYFTIIVASIGSSLFYADQVVHNADAALTQRLATRIETAAAALPAGQPVPLTLVGQHAFTFAGQLRRAELFGTSFYEHDQGNIFRVAYFMQLQGIEHIQPVWLGQRPQLIPSARLMPSWPAEGSVRLVDGVVIVKFGEPTAPQLRAD